MIRQYLEIKRAHPDKILFFHLGDFYEMFFDDAKTAARILHLTLTSRDGGGGKVPMAGIPCHSAENYIVRLLKSGCSIAICEQTEDPSQAKGLVRREVTRVITPGTVVSGALLQDKVNNYLAAVVTSPKAVALAFVDVTTGEFKGCQLEGSKRFAQAAQELARFQPAEILVPNAFPTAGGEGELLAAATGAKVTRLDDWKFSAPEAERVLLEHFRVESLEGFGLSAAPQTLQAAGALLVYLRETTHSILSHILTFSTYGIGESMMLDAATQRNLEILSSLRDASSEGTLLSAVDETVTAAGGRLLRRWLLSPLTVVLEIQKRQDAVEEWLSDSTGRSALRDLLAQTADLERLCGKLGCAAANARDLAALRDTLKILPDIAGTLEGKKAELNRQTAEQWDVCADLRDLLEKALVDHPPLAVKEGGIIREGYHAALDELREASRKGKDWLAAFEEEERRRTGISSLKVRFNSVFGYYIEISKANLNKVPGDYQRKQTLVNAERFFTPKLKEMEDKILGAEEKADRLEYELFDALRAEVSKGLARLQQTAARLALLDVLAAVAQYASRGRKTRPKVDHSLTLSIREGRHPVLERLLAHDRFVPNDTHLGREDGARLMILTGPNMAGKSTYIRQTALLVLLAQVGFFVPAESMHLGVVDRIFSRVGASDALTQGQSTFMVEMVETANILNHATEHSLLILDEVGRGTSTYDGVSIAWAVAEYIAEKIKARTLFATHYHELTRLAENLPQVKNYNIAVREWNDQIIFLRKVVEGATDKSYGIHVARLAGVPREVLERAKAILRALEAARRTSGVSSKDSRELELPLPLEEKEPPTPRVHPLLEELAALDPDAMTPLEALAWLSKARRRLENP